MWTNSQNVIDFRQFDSYPKTPKNFDLSSYNSGGSAYPILSYSLNNEPDVFANSSQGYLVERKLNNGSFTQIGTVSGQTTQFIDYTYDCSDQDNSFTNVSYRIRANDLYGNSSNYTDAKTLISGTTTSNVTLSGNINIAGVLTSGEGTILTFEPGTNANFINGAQLFAYGTINAVGTSTSPITFTSVGSNNFGNITFDPSAEPPLDSLILSYCNINNCDGIKCINGGSTAVIKINNCSLLNPDDGIYIYNSAPQIINNNIYNPQHNGIYGEASGLYPLIQENIITRITNLHNYQGIYLGNSTCPYILNNKIRGFCWGVYFGGGCITTTGWDMELHCNNIVTKNSYGIGTGWGSYTLWGQDDRSGMGNSTDSNDIFDAYTYEYSYLHAHHDYWGDTLNFGTDGTCTFDMGDYLTSDPCSGFNESSKLNAQNSNSLKKSGGDNFLAGLQLEKEGKIDEAIAYYKNLIINDNHALFGLTKLMYIKNKYSRPEIANYYESQLTSQTKYYGKVKNLIGDMYLQNDRFDDAIKAYNDVIKNSTTVYDGINARFEKLFAYLHIKNDPVTASQILSDIKGLNSKDMEVQMRINNAENLILGTNKTMGKSANSVVDNIPKTYALFQNYPNPFNPVTTIKYQIPKPGLVSLKVYDILGREVATLVNENKIEGSYDFTFNASRFPSGVYIYQIRVNDYVSCKKMLLLK